MKKLYFITLFGILLTGSIIANPIPTNFVLNYDVIDLDFLRTRYFEIKNWRPIQFEGTFSSYKWIPPYQYKERLSEIGFNVNQYHVVQFTIKEKDDFHYVFPICLFKTNAGDLNELDQLVKGDRIMVYGRFFNLKKSENAVEVDAIETIKKGGHDRNILLNAMVAPTFTPTVTVTNTPGPNLFQKLNNWVNPKETPTPTGTTTPGPNK